MLQVDQHTILSVVAPLYNEWENLDQFLLEVRKTLQNLDFPGQYEIVLVNDGSTDGTTEKLDELATQLQGEVLVLHLSRNFGHAAAVSAGLDFASGDMVILMDADMQDDPAVFDLFVTKWREGYDVVYAIRTSRQESLLFRMAFRMFYRLLRWVVKVKLPIDAGNFCLLDRRIVDRIQTMPERNRYFPGLRAWVGFRQIGVPSRRRRRYDQRTRVGFHGLVNLAMNAFFSFSYFPIAMFRIAGMIALIFSMFTIGFALYHKFITGKAVPTWTSNLVTTSFLGGINLLGIGVLGEYIARIYDEIKQRPIYIVDRVVGEKRK
jgi:glycosyltransferase involved in cell wall biosynthesis